MIRPAVTVGLKMPLAANRQGMAHPGDAELRHVQAGDLRDDQGALGRVENVDRRVGAKAGWAHREGRISHEPLKLILQAQQSAKWIEAGIKSQKSHSARPPSLDFAMSSPRR